MLNCLCIFSKYLFMQHIIMGNNYYITHYPILKKKKVLINITYISMNQVHF